MFRRREKSQVRSALARLFQSVSQRLGVLGGVDAEVEASRRLEAAIAADNLALDY